MKHVFYLVIFLVVYSNVNAQKFFIKDGDDAKVKTHLNAWLSSNGFVSAREINADYVIKFSTEKVKGKKVKIVFEVTKASSQTSVAFVLSDLIKNPSYLDYIAFADAKLLGPLKKIRKNEASTAAVTFTDTVIVGTRGKRHEIKYVDLDVQGSDNQTFDVLIERVSPGEDVQFNQNPNSQVTILSGKAKGSLQLELLVKADTTIKDDREHVFNLKYRVTRTQDYTTAKSLRFKVLAVAPKKNAPLPFPRNDLMLFVGTTLDPNNVANKVQGFSVEAVAPFQIADHSWMRIGGYFHPNFSRDSSSVSRRELYRLNQLPLVIDNSLVGRATSRIDVGYRVETMGLFVDLFRVIDNSRQKFQDKAGVRVSPAMHFEWARRVITPQATFTSIGSDTVLYTSEYEKYKILDRRPTVDNYPYGRSIFTHLYLTIGTMIEANYENLYLYFQAQAGWRHTAIRRSSPGIVDSKRDIPSANLKLGIMIKKTFNIMADIQDIGSGDDYVNISLGIPFNLTEALKKLPSSN